MVKSKWMESCGGMNLVGVSDSALPYTRTVAGLEFTFVPMHKLADTIQTGR